MTIINDFLDKQISIADQLNLLNLPKIEPPQATSPGKMTSKVSKRKARRAAPYKGGAPYLSNQSEYFINIYQYNFFLDIINSIFMVALNNITGIADESTLKISHNFLRNSMILSFFLNTEFYNNDYDFISEDISRQLYNKFFFIHGSNIFSSNSNIKTQSQQTQQIKLIINNSIVNVVLEYFKEPMTTPIQIIAKFNEHFQQFSSLYPDIDALFKITQPLPPPPPPTPPAQPVVSGPDDQLYMYLDLYFGTLTFPYREVARHHAPPYSSTSAVDCISDNSINLMCNKIKLLFLGNNATRFVLDEDFSALSVPFIKELLVRFQDFTSIQQEAERLIDISGPEPAFAFGTNPVAVQGGKIKYKKSKKIKKNRKTKKNKKVIKNRKTKKNKKVKKNKKTKNNKKK